MSEGEKIGSGEKPHPDYDLHVDLYPCPASRCVGHRDRVAVRHSVARRTARQPSARAPELELISPTLPRVGTGCSPAGCPGGHRGAGREVRAVMGGNGEIDTARPNHWTPRRALRTRRPPGGSTPAACRCGSDNAHHTLFDAESLRAAVAEFFEWRSCSPTTSATCASTPASPDDVGASAEPQHQEPPDDFAVIVAAADDVAQGDGPTSAARSCASVARRRPAPTASHSSPGAARWLFMLVSSCSVVVS